MNRQALAVLLALLTGLTLAAAPAWAADQYPSRPIQVLVPFPPGGTADLVARPFSVALEKVLKQPVAVVNKTGAGGAVGMQAASVAKPDGYNLMVALSSISVMPEVDNLFGRTKTYALEDFTPIALLSADPTLFVVKADRPWKNVAEFVADAQKRPGEIKYSSSGVYGTLHVSMELFANPAGIKLKHIPTGGGGPAVTSILGGHVDCLASGPPPVLPHIKAGALRVLACFGEKRLAAFPDVPTFQELGYKDTVFYIWAGFFAPKATPPQAIKVLREATRKAVDSPEFKTAMEKMETPIHYLDGDDFKKFWDADAKRLIEGVRRIGKVTN